MNIFRLAGDMTHLMSICLLLLKIHTIKSCAGLSLKTQELYALVFATRYLDLFTNFVSLYNTVMKLIFLGSSCSIVWYMRSHKVVRQSYDKEQDTFRHVFLIVPCAVLALLINNGYKPLEVLWTFSIYLEAVAILPQLVLLQRTKNVDNLTGNYVFFLGYARLGFLSVRSLTLGSVWISGIIQTALYADFFYYYLNRLQAAAAAALHPKAGLDVDMTALALGPDGPLAEEFWENVTRYISFFFTVLTGGLYSIARPIGDLLRRPLSAVLTLAALSGGFYLTYLTISAMLGITPYEYDYSP
eukprot:SM000131S26725  [mRNA]  locus=s131:250426:257697:+ [translate_table: standard]